MRRLFNRATLMSLREMPSEDALALLAVHCKADPTYEPLKQMTSRRWHARTECGEFEILTTGVKWYDTRVMTGGGGAIDLAMHVLQVSFVEAVRRLTERTRPRG